MGDQVEGMRGTESYSAERPGDFGQKIKSLARRKRLAKGRPSFLSSSSSRGFQEVGQPEDMPVPNLLTDETV